MKKLTNVSPFLLLLVPIFVMLLITFTVGSSNQQQEDSAMKTSVTKASIAKVNR